MLIHKYTGFCCELLLSIRSFWIKHRKKDLDQTQHLNAVSTQLQSESPFLFFQSRSQFCTVGLLWCRGRKTSPKPKTLAASLIQQGWLLTQSSMKIEPISSPFRATAPNCCTVQTGGQTVH